jgi:hypothetical protein
LKEVKGCVHLLREMFASALGKISGADSNALDKEYRDIEVDETWSGSNQPVVPGSRSTGGGGSTLLSKNTCSRWFAGGLGIKDKKSGALIRCSKPQGKLCTRDHISPSAVTKQEAVKWNELESMRDLKVRLGGAIEDFKRFRA